ncbi:MAG: hypothetical protein KBC94_23080 [Pseudacidovorax sp.]|uniref:hypothetical protein n=1 Tax=Pseudacidovorax sp. TaxID=1934311 RepID=UPI001B51C835|nr:hypothetical protein [Pseudacidovorax sp.]MBP6897310.1 hypothetical protein [Pseudacidovorax sp.]
MADVPGGIENAVIRPEAEAGRAQAQASASAEQEARFYDEAGRQYALQQNRQAMGWLGKFWGSGGASTNIAGLVAFVALAIYVASMVFSPPDASNIRSGMLALATAALGYIFGSSKKGD